MRKPEFVRTTVPEAHTLAKDYYIYEDNGCWIAMADPKKRGAVVIKHSKATYSLVCAKQYVAWCYCVDSNNAADIEMLTFLIETLTITPDANENNDNDPGQLAPGA